MIEITNKTRSVISIPLVRKVAGAFLSKHKKRNRGLSIVFVGDNTIRKLNSRYRKIDKTTDVLAFEGDDDLLGEIMISYPQIKRQAKAMDKSVKSELVFILVHGLLHLIGYDDQAPADREKMIKLGEEFIKNNNFLII